MAFPRCCLMDDGVIHDPFRYLMKPLRQYLPISFPPLSTLRRNEGPNADRTDHWNGVEFLS